MRTREVMPPYFLGLRLLKKNPEGMTTLELCVAVGIAKKNMSGYIKLWREKNLVYISGWRRAESNKGDWVPVYGLKPSERKLDVKKPAPMTDAEKQAAYRDRHRAEINAKRRYRRAKKLGIEVTPFSHLNARTGILS